MSSETITKARRLKDGTLVEVLADGITRPLPPDETDWGALRTMTDEEVHAAALSDPDAQPLTEDDFKRMKRTPQVKVMRRALRLSQEEFATRYHIPIGTLRDWEQGRSEPDQAARAYLTVIAREPDVVREALEKRS